MTIDARIRFILLDKLNFSSVSLRKLEENQDLLSRTLGLIELIREKNLPKERKLFIRQQLKKIRQTLERQSQNHALLSARAAYYSFNRVAQ
ncbi:MAG: hypothetical protein GY786_16895 [Proteobacteria bacterium]|nr:hypothetical protein [Pseudomonadota bacterium]